MKQLPIALLLCINAWAQCAMCFRNAESQTKARAEAMNKGILVLAIPLAVSAGAIGLLAYKRRARTIETGG
ncbi:MAG: hypothetical protein HYX27_25320 [Acidobacteria bacterium]|nr:hypothetical protein [Acidobacteriota bacterium]